LLTWFHGLDILQHSQAAFDGSDNGNQLLQRVRRFRRQLRLISNRSIARSARFSWLLGIFDPSTTSIKG
jgi:hypothetical protein